MKRFLLSIGSMFAVWFMGYLVFSFMFWEFDPAMWGESRRVACAVLFVLPSFVLSCLVYTECETC